MKITVIKNGRNAILKSWAFPGSRNNPHKEICLDNVWVEYLLFWSVDSIDDPVVLQQWCEDNLQGRFVVYNPFAVEGPRSTWATSLHLETDEDLLLVRLRWETSNGCMRI